MGIWSRRINELIKFSTLLFVLDVYALVNYSVMDKVVINNILKGHQYKKLDLVHLEQLGNYLEYIHYGVFIFFAITFIAWFFTSFSTIQKFDNRLYESKYWTIISWIVPVFNLFLPFTMLAKMFRVTYSTLKKHNIDFGKQYPFILFFIWWCSYLIVTGANFIIRLYYIRTDTLFYNYAGLSIQIIMFIGALICYNFVRHYIHLQRKLDLIVIEEEK
ncbi:DUF4328 domain-containing protein [Myroides injenensis]|uniref:DUF4328 domain-containing protein n=1 Tax=Myroides injenensis TaxID=1183151 RepID=UPI000289F54B|nr:DUF4328 domain-containing protein [Myroides injenensis]